MPDNGWPADRIDTQHAHSARIYDYILGGKDYYPADQEAGDAMAAEWPALPIHMRANRDWMNRAVRWLVEEAGVRQFLDVGTGIPTSPNLHEIAQSVAPESRVVYVDNDPIVLTLSQGLLTSTPGGRTAYAEADFRDPASILSAPELRATLDLDRPVALTVIAIVHFMLDEDDAVGVVRRLLEPLPSGSYLAMSIGTAEFAPREVGRVAREYAARDMPMRLRTLAEAHEFFEGLELVEPGITQVHKWHPDGGGDPDIRDEDIAMYGAVARKP
ncbi:MULTISPECIES: SAM-dependent methyltransferase [Streptomyces]|uniref:SAM-dependent methyltransferase n=1 Tax=Streptomyces doudnae TaxID=3075536 RepID=A0ABD5EVQ7_9ACTN|nr:MULTISPECIES: SAM-dependent methyltransferase [unclassified Streptomyces]MDT0438333.1 SAM-dependent methyltransferase [Streptomyces sp. DSM 41981]MYQ68356.1 SAM-dependent methyltransferase [Streptomyces sp. SID4950]SCE45413.1 S-adenosyl methyltransferase [Streptomyces sp. SolWspMP-5a-2]